MDGVSSKKDLLKWMIWGYHYFRKHLYIYISTKLITQSASGSHTWRPVFRWKKTAVVGVREWVFLKMDGWISCRTNECRLLQWDPEIDEIEVGTLNLDIYFLKFISACMRKWSMVLQLFSRLKSISLWSNDSHCTGLFGEPNLTLFFSRWMLNK